MDKQYKDSKQEGMTSGCCDFQNPDGWNSTSSGTKSATCSNGMRSNDLNSKSSISSYTRKPSNYHLDMKPRQHFNSTVPKSFLQSQDIRSMNKSPGLAKGTYQSSGSFSSFPNHETNNASAGRRWNDSDRYKSREKCLSSGESEELTRGPRTQSLNTEFEDDKYNLEDFQTKYDAAKFYVIKSYSEDDVHKCLKYDVWSSTANGNKKLDAAFRETNGKINIFLFFSVNGSGQFVGVAEMIGPVDYEKNMDFWQHDKWNGFFPVKWHIVKDVPNAMLRHIILENNDNRPVTYTRDTQEVGLKQGCEMLEIFKRHSAKTSLLDDISFYENREKMIKAKKKSQNAGEWIFGERSTSSSGSTDPTPSLVNLTRNLSLNPDTIATSRSRKPL